MSIDGGADRWAVGGAGSPRPDPVVAAVGAAIAALQDSDPAGLTPTDLGDRVVRVEQALAMLGWHQVACVQTMDARGDAAVLGFRSTASWLRAAARLAPGAAKGLVALARRIVEREPTATALAQGRVSMAHAQILARTMSEIAPSIREPAHAAKIEGELVQLAEQTNPLRLSAACRRLRIQALPELAGCDDWDAFAQRDLSVSRTFAGLGVINGTLDPLGAETVMTAVHSFAGPAGADDDRTPGQRRADALVEICRRVLVNADAPLSGGERPQVSVIVPLTALEERAGAQPGELAWTGPISPQLLRRILCDAAITRIVTDGQSQPLDVGRTTRVVPAGMRRAVMTRDLCCQHPGCDVPAVWCDCHHIQQWSRGGLTAITNLIMLCGYHHTRLHTSGQTIARHPNGHIEIIPDEHHHGPATGRGP